MEEIILIPYRKKDKWGYCDFDKNLIIPCQFDGAEPFIEDRAIVYMRKDTTGCLGFIDKKGNFVCDIKYTSVDDFKNGFAAVSRNGKWGFINKEGQEQIPVIYDNVLNFSEGIAAVKLNGKFGFIDIEGNPITKFNYDNCDSFVNGYASVMEEGLQGAIDREGKEVVPCISYIPVEFSEGLAAISLINTDAPMNPTAQRFKDFDESSLIGYEKDGEIIYQDSFGNVYDRESMELASKNHRRGYVNAERQTVIGFEYYMGFPFSEGIACVALGGKYGFIDKSGSWVAEPVYEDAGDCKEGLARVRKDGKWGYINRGGDIVIDFLYENAFDFSEGFAKVVRIDPKRNQGFQMSGLINHKGEELFYPSYTTDDEEDWSYAELYHDQVIEGFITYKDLDDRFFIHDVARGDDMMLPYNVKEVFPYKNGLCKVVLEGLKGKILTSYIGVYWDQYWED